MWPVAKQTLKAAVRYRFVVALGLALLVIVFGVPLLLKSDGTAKGMVQLVLTYTLGATTVLLGIASLWMGCGTLAREIEDNVMQMVAVKPVARWRVWLGKWLGIMLLNAALLVPTGLAIFFLVNARANSPDLNDNQRAKLQDEVLVSRSSVELQKPDFTINRARAYTYSKLVELGKSDNQYTDAEQELRMSVTQPEHVLSLRPKYTELIERAEKNPSSEVLEEIEELEHQAVQVSRGSREIVLPGQLKTWVFEIDSDKVDRINEKPIYLRFKFNAGDEYDPKSHLCLWSVGAGTGKRWPTDSEFQEMTIGSSVFHDLKLELDGGVVPDQGENRGLVVVSFANNNDKPIVFPMDDGPIILYHDGGFGMNLARGLMIIFFWLGLISAIGLMASSFLSFPVATFMSLGILLISASTGTLEQIVEEEGITGINHETGRKDESSALDNVAILFSKGVLSITDLVWGYSPVDHLSSGRTITWATLGMAFVGIVLLMGGMVSAFGAFMFQRRELALPNPTASMN
ncbi:MAG: ABC transporter permease [Verrucomicrobiota bacterium]|nr:ABC transporter permease [Verrucomicrobiota bacterium]